MIGVGFFLPILPLVMAGRGGSPALVGAVFASAVAGRALAQYPAGWLADRHGRRPVVVLSIFLYALVFPVYVVPIPSLALVAVRFVHSAIGGAYLAGATALVADLAGEQGRSQAFGRLRATDMVGMLVGPALGGLVAGLRLDLVFVAGTVICLAATLLLTRLPRLPRPSVDGTAGHRAGRRSGSGAGVVRSLLPLVALGAPLTWTYGIYDTVWSLYMTSRGATPLVVGVSFATYALPIALLAGLAGGLGDRLGYARVASVAVLGTAVLSATYGFVSNIPALVALGAVEGALGALAAPSLMAAVSRVAPPGAQARTQSLYTTQLTIAEALGAAAGGALLGISPLYAFGAASGACLAGAAAGAALRGFGRAGEAPG